MDRRIFAASVFAAAVGLAGAAVIVTPAAAQMMTKEQMMQVQNANMERAKSGHLVSCYGINAAAKNDCAAGAHSCAGQATSARDTKSFVLLPAGDCEKIAGGALKAS
jgi:uncharacterized membrane protein